MALLRRRKAPVPGWEQLRDECLLVSIARQRRLAESGLAAGGWTLDLVEGVADIGGRRTRIGLLGDASDWDNTFTFGDAHARAHGIAAELAQPAVRARAAAQRHPSPVFARDTVAYADADPAELASVCNVLAGGVAMFGAPHDTGRLYVTLDDFALEPLDTTGVYLCLAEIAGVKPLSHRTALTALLEAEGFAVARTGAGLTGTRGDDVLEVSLTAGGRFAGASAPGVSPPRP